MKLHKTGRAALSLAITLGLSATILALKLRYG